MAETTSEQDQRKKSEQAGEPTWPQPAVETPQPEFGGAPLSLSVAPGLGSPDGFEKRVGDGALRRNANRQPRAQTLTAMQRQFGNQHVQRFMVQRRAAGESAPVQRQGGGNTDTKDDAGSIKIDEKGVTTATYNPPSMNTSNESFTPSADAKPNEDKIDATATVTAVFKVTTSVSLPSVPGGLTACQTKRVQDALRTLKAHEDQHVAAMQQYDGTFTTTVTVKGVTKAGAPAALIAAAKPAVDAEGATRKKTAQDASDKLDQPPFVINVDLNCEDEKKPGKKNVEDMGAQPELAGGAEAQPAAEGGQPPAEPA